MRSLKKMPKNNWISLKMGIWFCAQDLFWIWIQFWFWFCLWDKIIKNVMVNNSLKWGHPPSVLGWINSWDVYLQIQLSNVYLWTESGWWHQCMFSTILSHRQILNLNQTQIQNKSWAQNQIPIFQWNPIVFRHLFLTSYSGSIQNEVAMQNNKQNLIMYLPSYCAQNCIKI